MPGDFYALLGPNGAGKSTLIGIISSLVNKSLGEVSVFGVDLARDHGAAMRLIGLVPQEINFNMFEMPQLNDERNDYVRELLEAADTEKHTGETRLANRPS